MVMHDTGFMALRSSSRIKGVSFRAVGGEDDEGVFKL